MDRNIPNALPKIAPSLSGSGPTFGLTRVHTPNGISIGSAVSAQLMVVTNRQTHKPRCTCSDMPYLPHCVNAMPPKDKSKRKTHWESAPAAGGTAAAAAEERACISIIVSRRAPSLLARPLYRPARRRFAVRSRYAATLLSAANPTHTKAEFHSSSPPPTACFRFMLKLRNSIT